MGCLFFSLWLIELNTAPVDTVFYYSFTLSLSQRASRFFLTSFKEEHNSNYLAAVRANSVLTKLV